MSIPPLFFSAVLAVADPGPPPVQPVAVTVPDAPAPVAPAAPATAAPAEPAPAASPAPAAQNPADQGAIVVSGQELNTPGDPMERLNAQTFEVVQGVDKAFVGPVSHGYEAVVPKPMRDGVHNVLTQLEEPTVFVNDLLQLHPGRAIKTLARFTINTVFGFGGLFDVARRPYFGLPHHRNGFAYTLGYYGVKPGPYLFLPLIGSTTARDLPGRIMDLSLLSFAVGKPFKSRAFGLGRGVMASIDDRLALDAELHRIRDQNEDPYAAMRTYYMTKRQAEIDALHGHTPETPVLPTSAAPTPAASPAPKP